MNERMIGERNVGHVCVHLLISYHQIITIYSYKNQFSLKFMFEVLSCRLTIKSKKLGADKAMHHV